MQQLFRVPAKAGTHGPYARAVEKWVPACAGTRYSDVWLQVPIFMIVGLRLSVWVRVKMSEMIDRLILVARAVYAAGCATGGELDNEFWRLVVRSQIEAKRDPTAAMLTAADRMNSAEEIWRVMISTILG